MKFPLRNGGCYCDAAKTTATPVLINFFNLNNKAALKLTATTNEDLYPAICIAAQLQARGHWQYRQWLIANFPHFTNEI